MAFYEEAPGAGLVAAGRALTAPPEGHDSPAAAPPSPGKERSVKCREGPGLHTCHTFPG